MPARQSYLRRARHWIANRGLRGFAREMYYRFLLLIQGKPLPGRETADRGRHPFDEQHGVDTAGLVWGEDLNTAKELEASRYWATGYYGIGPSAFTGALHRLALDWPRFTFVDIGCGKGRALLLAFRFPFRRLLGVELSPALAATAQHNLGVFSAPWRHPDTPAEAIAADATTFAIPSGPVVFFLYHPFAAPVMRQFLAHVKQAARAESRDIYLLYANPELDALIREDGSFHQLWREYIRLNGEDSAADRFNSTGESFAAYRLR